MNIRIYDPHFILEPEVITKEISDNISLINISTKSKYVMDWYVGSYFAEKKWGTICLTDDNGIYAEVAVEGYYDHITLVPLKHQYEIILLKDIWPLDLNYEKTEPVYVEDIRDIAI